MSDDDLIVVLPWLIFVVGLAVIGWRLVVSRVHGRGRRRGPPGAPGA
jgi:hypothetical protein